MILSLFSKKANTAHVFAVYSAIVAQSRQKKFYADWQVPDTVNGRFDMVSLHLCLLFRRLKTGEETTRVFSQAVFDLFFKDMDQSLREMGAGDMAVPKRIQKMGELFYGMLDKMTTALDQQDVEALRSVIQRNVYDGEETDGLPRLAAYVLSLEAELNALETGVILSGSLQLKAAP